MKHISLINGLAHVARAKAYFEDAKKSYNSHGKMMCYNTCNKLDYISNEWLNNAYFTTEQLQQIRKDVKVLIDVERNLAIDSINELLMQMSPESLDTLETFLRKQLNDYESQNS